MPSLLSETPTPYPLTGGRGRIKSFEREIHISAPHDEAKHILRLNDHNMIEHFLEVSGHRIETNAIPLNIVPQIQVLRKRALNSGALE